MSISTSLLRLAPLLLALLANGATAVELIVTGPAGANGQNATPAANGTAGAAAPAQTYFTGVPDSAISLLVSGGAGGQGGDGLPASAGNPERAPGAGGGGAAASATLSAVPASGPVNAVVSALGGHGGNAGATGLYFPFDYPKLGASGGSGGGAAANVNAIAVSPSAVVAGATAVGGDGGSGTGASYAGGDGGAAGATVSAWSVTGPATGGADVNASAVVTGGRGGDGLVLANGGNGGNAAVQSFSARSVGMLTLNETVTGGAGGDSYGGIGGQGGIANAHLNYFSFDPVAGINASITASGGGGGNGFGFSVGPDAPPFFGAGGAGGNASSVLDLQSARPATGVSGAPVSGSASAYGGNAGGAFIGSGDTGSAYALASVRAYGVVSSSSTAVGGSGGARADSGPGGGTAIANAYSNESANANASANGGYVRQNLGTASASAYAEVARSQRDIAAGGPAIATAVATGGLVNAAARSSAADQQMGASTQSSTVSNIDGGGYTIGAYAGSRVGGVAVSAPAFFFGAASYATVLPAAAEAHAALAVAPHVASALGGGTILGMSGQADTFNSYVTSSEMNLVNFYTGRHLLVGFWLPSMDNAYFTELDFSIRDANTVLLSRSFTSLASAMTFFDDKVIDLGLLGGQSLDLIVSTNWNNANFAFGYAFGAVRAVPEANVWLMLGAGLLLLFATIRRGRTRGAA